MAIFKYRKNNSNVVSTARNQNNDLTKSDFVNAVEKFEFENNNNEFYINTFWVEKSIDDLYEKEDNLIDVEFDQKLYDDSLLELNKVCWEIKKKIKTTNQTAIFERLRTILLGNNMIPRFCGYGVKYDYQKLKNTLIYAIDENISTDQIFERIERDVCCGMCLAFAPFYVELLNTTRFTFTEVKEFTNQIETNKKIRRNLLGFAQTFMEAFDYADSKTLNKFMLETNFAPAFGLKNAFISFNHIYDNIEKYCDPAKINGIVVPVNLVMNCYKIIDKKMNVNYFKNKDFFELKNKVLERDKILDKTKIVEDKGEKEWMN